MKPDEIREIRALLAAQPPPPDPRPALIARVADALAPRLPSRRPAPVVPRPPPLPDEVLDPAPLSPATAAIPPEILLGSLGPRRPAFGQRPVESGPADAAQPGRPGAGDARPSAEPFVLLEAVGGARTDRPASLREVAADHAEAPFFEDDLLDLELPPSLSGFGRAAAADPFAGLPPSAAEPGEPDEAPSPELARTYLLAGLAAKLAAEAALVERRLSAARCA